MKKLYSKESFHISQNFSNKKMVEQILIVPKKSKARHAHTFFYISNR